MIDTENCYFQSDLILKPNIEKYCKTSHVQAPNAVLLDRFGPALHIIPRPRVANLLQSLVMLLQGTDPNSDSHQACFTRR